MTSGVYKRTEKHKEQLRRNLKDFIGQPISDKIKEKISEAKINKFKGETRGARNYQARKIWGRYYKFKIPKGFLIHHRDENINNNAIENLVLLTYSGYYKAHETN